MNYRTNEDKRIVWGLNRPLYNNFISKTFTNEGTEPLTLAEIKAHLKVTYDDEDDYLTELAKRCRAEIEERDRTSYVTRTVRALIKNELGGQALLFGPVTGNVSDITAADLDGNAIDIDNLEIKGDGGGYSLVSPYDHIVLTYTAGYLPDEVPLTVKQDILELIAYKWVHRGDTELIRRAGVWLV